MKQFKSGVLVVVILLSIYTIRLNYNDVIFLFNYIFNKEQKIIISEINDYQRNYTYEKFYNSDDYTPENIDDLKNIYYNVLNNGWSSFTFYCPTEYKDCLHELELISSDENMLSNINNYVNPYNSFKIIDTTITSFGEITINVQKNYSAEDIDTLKAKVLEISENLGLQMLNDKKSITEIHKYIINNTKYDLERADNGSSVYNSDTAYGVLIQGYGVCSGYSDAFALFMDYLNIPNIKVSSKEHIWNLIYIDNKWLHVDVTWDDNDNSPLIKSNFLLINTKELKSIDDEYHEFDESFFIETN